MAKTVKAQLGNQKTRSYKNLLAAVLIIISAVFPYSHSEAQSVQEAPLSVLQCDNLNRLDQAAMSEKEEWFALRCDSLEAEAVWEQVYGQMTENDLIAGMVIEP